MAAVSIRRRVRAAAVVVATVTALAACADDSPAGGGEIATTTTATTTTTTAVPSTTAAPSTTAPPPPTSTSVAAPTTTAPAPAQAPTEPRPPLSNADGSNDAFSGIGQLTGLGSTCTAFLLDVGAPSGPAYAMTNGHCVGLFDSTTALRDQPGDGGSIRFRLFADTPTDVADIPVASVRYATMRGTDVAILELDASRSDLAGLTFYGLGAPPRDGDAIRNVGIPVAGVDPTQLVLRGGACTAGATVRVVEFEWLWDAPTSNDCGGVLGGSSGSPVFNARSTARAVGVVNTTTIAAPDAAGCPLNGPCELTAVGAVRQPDRSYAMPVQAWARCFVPQFDAGAAGCPTEVAPVTVEAPLRSVQPGATWAATVAGGAGGVRVVKSGPGGTTDCRTPDGYVLAPPDGAFNEPLPPVEGVYVLCGAELDGRNVPITADAGVAVMEVDATAPSAPIALSRVTSADDVRVEPIFAPPELSSFDLKTGRTGEIDCADPAGYSVYQRIPIVVAAADLPAVVCVIGEDEAGNRGDPQAFDLP